MHVFSIIKIFILIISSNTQIVTLRQFNNGNNIGNTNYSPDFIGYPFLCAVDLVHISQNKTIDYNHSMSETGR
jgi:hypothetical protein